LDKYNGLFYQFNIIVLNFYNNSIKEAKEASDRNTEKFYGRLNNELAVTQFVAGDRFTIADITLLTAIDFATAMVDLKPDSVLTNLYRWHKEVSERPSSKM